jgi:methionyl-tRNA synthetase
MFFVILYQAIRIFTHAEEIWYSVSDEEFFTETQLAEVYRDDEGNVIGGKAPSIFQSWFDEVI